MTSKINFYGLQVIDEDTVVIGNIFVSDGYIYKSTSGYEHSAEDLKKIADKINKLKNIDKVVTPKLTDELLLKLVRQLNIMTNLTKLKFGNSDKLVYAEIEKSESLLERLNTE